MRKSKIDAARQMKQLIFEFSTVPLPNLKVKKNYLINELRKVKIKGEKDFTEITFTKSLWSSIDALVPLVNPQDIHNVLLKYLPPQLIETEISFSEIKRVFFPLFFTTSSLDAQAVVPPSGYCYSYESLGAMRLTGPARSATPQGLLES